MPDFPSDLGLVAAAPESFLTECRGANNGLLFIGIEAEAEPEARLLFLKKILAALKLDLEGDTIYKVMGPGEGGSFLQLLKKKGIERMVVFGLSPGQFGLAFECRFYEPVNFYGCRFLFSERLSVVEADPDRKAKLWGALKPMFG